MRNKTDKMPTGVTRGKIRRKSAKTEQKNPRRYGEPELPVIFDPELLYIECGRCGAPVLWEPGRASRFLEKAGIDPSELDPACMLITDACPACSHSDEYSVRIFRLTDKTGLTPPVGHA